MTKDTLYKFAAGFIIAAAAYAGYMSRYTAGFQAGCKKGAGSVFEMLGYRIEEKALVGGCEGLRKQP